ncbi:hypothetical protein [Olleya marilimosa]|uniref:hypothetical protein n=1 Tax=Olleya marilimosa TaxID=272164 RepID=UPI0030ECFB3F
MTLVALFFRVRAVKKALKLANKKVNDDTRISHLKILDNKDKEIDKLIIETEKLKIKWNQAVIDRDRLETEKLCAVFGSVDENSIRKESLIALKDFNAFIFNLNKSLSVSDFYEDEAEYHNDVVHSMEINLKLSISFMEEFLNKYPHIYESNGVISRLDNLLNKCKSLSSSINQTDNYQEHLNSLIVYGPELGETWDELHAVFRTIRRENDMIITLKKEYMSKLNSK